MKISIINKSSNPLPKYETEQSAGMDICADLKGSAPVLHNAFMQEDSVIIRPGGRALIFTGLYMSLPVGYEAQICPRSGLAIKKGITVLNSPGTIDADYRGEVGIILINHSSENFKVEQGDKIAQMVIAKHERAEWNETKELDETERGEGGFGHTSEKVEETKEEDETKVPANRRRR